MIQQPTPQEVIGIALRSQYLANAAIRNSLTFQEKQLDVELPVKLYVERRGLQWMYNNNPSNPLLIKTANYVLSLCGEFVQQSQNIISNLSKTPPAITGPSNVSVNVGANAVFSVSVVSSLPVIYQWYVNGSPVVGAISSSYTIGNAQLSQSGSTVYVKATNSAGTTTSNVAILTVTATLVAYGYSGDTDYSLSIKGGVDNVPYQFNFNVVSGQDIIAQFPGNVNAKYIVIKYPAAWGMVGHYQNPPIDSGVIPGLALDNGSIGSYRYAFSRSGNPFTINSSNALTLTT